MNTIQSQPIKTFKSQKELKKLFNTHIYSALQSAMSIKTDEMSERDFKNLVQFILNVKCQLI